MSDKRCENQSGGTMTVNEELSYRSSGLSVHAKMNSSNVRCMNDGWIEEFANK